MARNKDSGQDNSADKKKGSFGIRKTAVTPKPKGKSAAAHVADVAEDGGAVTRRTWNKAQRQTGGGLNK